MGNVSFMLQLSRESVFLFLPDSATVFPPSYPSVSYCLEFFWKYINIWAVFSPVNSNSVIIVMLIEVSIKCCCIAVWQTKCIQCARNNFFERLNFVVFYFRSTKHSIFVVNFQVFLKEILGFR